MEYDRADVNPSGSKTAYTWINDPTAFHPPPTLKVPDYTPPSPKSPPVKIARPQNAWILFRAHRSRERKAQGEERTTQGELSKLLALEWKNCAPEIRKRFEDEAKEKKAEHTRLYPDFKFRTGPVYQKTQSKRPRTVPSRGIVYPADTPRGGKAKEDRNSISLLESFAGNSQEPARYTFGTNPVARQERNSPPSNYASTAPEASTSSYDAQYSYPETSTESRRPPTPIPSYPAQAQAPVNNSNYSNYSITYPTYPNTYPATTNHVSNHHHYYTPRRPSIAIEHEGFRIPTHHQFINSSLMGINYDPLPYSTNFQSQTPIGTGAGLTQFTIPEDLDSEQIYAFDSYHQRGG